MYNICTRDYQDLYMLALSWQEVLSSKICEHTCVDVPRGCSNNLMTVGSDVVVLADNLEIVLLSLSTNASHYEFKEPALLTASLPDISYYLMSCLQLCEQIFKMSSHPRGVSSQVLFL